MMQLEDQQNNSILKSSITPSSDLKLLPTKLELGHAEESMATLQFLTTGFSKGSEKQPWFLPHILVANPG